MRSSPPEGCDPWHRNLPARMSLEGSPIAKNAGRSWGAKDLLRSQGIDRPRLLRLEVTSMTDRTFWWCPTCSCRDGAVSSFCVDPRFEFLEARVIACITKYLVMVVVIDIDVHEYFTPSQTSSAIAFSSWQKGCDRASLGWWSRLVAWCLGMANQFHDMALESTAFLLFSLHSIPPTAVRRIWQPAKPVTTQNCSTASLQKGEMAWLWRAVAEQSSQSPASSPRFSLHWSAPFNATR